MNLRDELLPDVTATLMELGAAATLTRVTSSGGSVNKAGGGTRSTQVLNTYAVIGPEQITDEQGRVLTATVATLLAQPLENDKLSLGGAAYVVGKVTSIAPQGQAIIWKAVVTQ